MDNAKDNPILFILYKSKNNVGLSVRANVLIHHLMRRH